MHFPSPWECIWCHHGTAASPGGPATETATRNSLRQFIQCLLFSSLLLFYLLTPYPLKFSLVPSSLSLTPSSLIFSFNTTSSSSILSSCPIHSSFRRPSPRFFPLSFCCAFILCSPHLNKPREFLISTRQLFHVLLHLHQTCQTMPNAIRVHNFTVQARKDDNKSQ